ncbi:glycosyltransferase family 4 protein [Candidatus Nomurabacteria bacterium]|nr:glycosyltransferase family 4 protein [Candidatus Nomurabacteria bacterium]
MKNTLIITLDFPPTIGGISTYIEQIAGELPPENFVVLAPKTKEKEYDQKYPFTVERTNFYYPRFIWPRWLRLYFTVKKLVKKYGIELIQVHHILPVGYVAYMMKKKFGIPYLVFSHGTDIAAASKKKRKKKLAMKVALNSQQVITNSESLNKRLLAQFPDLEGHSTVLYPCPDVDFFAPPEEEKIAKLRSQLALEGKRVILSIARLEHGKGFTNLTRHMPAILKEVPNLVWLIVGEGSQKQSLINLIKKHSLQNIVRFVGHVPHDDIKSYYYLSDLFILLTHPYQGMEEGLGLVFLEAAATGIPMIAGMSGGVEEAVADGRTGLVVDTYNEQQVAAAIKKLIEDIDYADRLGKAAQLRVRDEFHWDHQLAKLDQWMK